MAGFGAAVWVVAQEKGPAEAQATVAAVSALAPGVEATLLREEIEAMQGELSTANEQLERWHTVFSYSTRYGIPADLASSIYDVARAEKIDPELAFRLVRLESNFNERATSPVGAIGLTQVMPGTAKYFEKGITKERLYRRDVNLRIGFRYLRALIKEQKGNVRLALLVYNRGPAAVYAAKEAGEDPSNGYDRIVMKGYRGRGVID